MRTSKTVPPTISDYIATFPPKVRAILSRIRAIARQAAPNAEEVISYRMPALRQHGMLIYFAAFKKHIGLFPPVRGNAKLMKAIAPYAGPKGNLQFSLDEPIPYSLIEQIVKLRVKQNLAKAAETKKRTSKS